MALATATTEAQITELGSEPERWIPATTHLRAIDPSLPAEPLARLEITLQDDNHDRQIVILQTNNTAYSFVAEAVLGWAGHRYGIVQAAE